MSAAVPVIAIDGPSGSGKSTVARAVARALGYRYVDTGATYRALTWAALDRGVDAADARALVALADAVVVELDDDPDAPAVRVDGTDVSQQVRGPQVTAAVSAVSAVPELRQRMVALQRRHLRAPGAVAEGRDVGTVVAPDAAVKVFLVASESVRAARRLAQGEGSDTVAGTAAALGQRDRLDSERVSSPLRPASDAVEIDASALDVEQVVARVLALVAERLAGPPLDPLAPAAGSAR